MKKLILPAIFIALCAVGARAQTGESKLSEAAQMIDKLLDTTKAQSEVIEAQKQELTIGKDLRSKEEAYNAELLKAVALLTSSEKRSKSFFEKLRAQLGRVLMTATDPKNLAGIVSIILILDRLKK